MEYFKSFFKKNIYKKNENSTKYPVLKRKIDLTDDPNTDPQIKKLLKEILEVTRQEKRNDTEYIII